jgi:hypothetical protein
MSMVRSTLIGSLVAATLLAAAPAFAANPQEAIWKRSSLCTKESFIKFPDHTPDQAAKRDRYVKECQLRQRAPVQGPVGALPGPATSSSPGQE